MLKARKLLIFFLTVLIIINTAVELQAESTESVEEEPAYRKYYSYFSPSQERDWYVTPLLSVNVVNLSLGGGLVFYHDNVFNRRYQSEFYTFFGADGYENHYLKLSKRSPLISEIDFTADIGYKYAHEHFYGFGPDTIAAEKDKDDHDEGVYRIRQTKIMLLTGYSFPQACKIDLGFQWKNTVILDESEENLANTKQIDKLSGIDGGLTNNIITRLCYNLYKTRKDIAVGSVKVEYWLRIASPIIDSDYTFNKHNLSLKGLVNFPGRRYFSLTRANLETIGGIDDEIPFYEYPAIGGIDSVRGLQDNRYADKTAVSASQELFYQINEKATVSLFVDTGRVFPENKPFGLKSYQRSWGTSGIFKIMEIFNLSITLAKAEDRRYLAYYLTATDAF